MEKDEDVNEFRMVMEYFCFEDWEMIARRLGLAEYTIENVREQYRNKSFQERFYQILWKWKQFRPEKSNIDELIKVLRAQSLNGPADHIENAIKKYRSADLISKEKILQRAVLRWKQSCRETRNDEKQSKAVKEENLNEPALNIDDAQKAEPVETTNVGPAAEPITCVESVATVVNYLEKISIGSNNVTNVSFSNDGVWFSTVEKGRYIKIWEWATLSFRFQRKLDKMEVYAVYFNDGVSGDGGVCISVCDSKERLSVYKVEDEMPIASEVYCATSVTFGSWFKRDKFLSGTTNTGDNILCLRRICKPKRLAVVPADEILKRNDIRNATLFKTFLNKLLLCFKSGRNLEVIHLYEGDDKLLKKSESKLFNFDQGNVGFFKLSSDSRNLFVMKDSEGKDIHQFLNIELETLSKTTVDVHIQGPYEYCDFGVTDGKIIIGSYHENKSYFVYNLESKKCEQELRHKSNVCSVACHPTDQEAVITSDRGGNVLVWNLDDRMMKWAEFL